MDRRRWIRREARNLVLAALYSWRPPTDPVLVVAPYSRTGSYLLVDYLQSLIPMRGEVLNPDISQGLRRSAGRGTALRHIAASLRRQDGGLVGCKLLLHQMRQHDLVAADLVDRFPTGRFVVIYRQDIFRQYLSHEVARATRQWGSTAAPFTGIIRIEPDHLERHIFEYPAVLDHLVDQLPGDRRIVIAYEELAEAPQELFRDRVCPFLGIEYRPVSTGLSKRIGRPPAEVVENWSEVAHLADATALL